MASETICPSCHRPYKKGRSNQQNKYYWGVVIFMLSERTGFETEEMHEILKDEFLSVKKIWNDKIFRFSKSTTSLTTWEMEEYLRKSRKWAAEFLELSIPEPNEAPSEYSYVLPTNRRKLDG